MKKILLFSLVLILSFSAYSFWGFGRGNGQGKIGYGQGGYSSFEESEEVANYLSTLSEKYSLDEEDLSSDKLITTELEELGALLMASHAVDKEQLKFMQSRMGGENSKGLKDAYRFMASNYLSSYGMMGTNRSGMWGRKGGFGRACFRRGGRGFKNGNTYSEDSAFEILKKRYASGEITEKEYLEMKSILEK